MSDQHWSGWNCLRKLLHKVGYASRIAALLGVNPCVPVFAGALEVQAKPARIGIVVEVFIVSATETPDSRVRRSPARRPRGTRFR